MRIDMLLHDRCAESWPIPEAETPTWSRDERAEYFIDLADRYVKAMKVAYADLIAQMGDHIKFAIVLGSRANIIEIPDEEMKEFELSTKNKVYALED